MARVRSISIACSRDYDARESRTGLSITGRKGHVVFRLAVGTTRAEDGARGKAMQWQLKFGGGWS
jgi:hypothetical protein